MNIWGDVWFYVSAFGLASSCALFGFFLRQYRLAVQAAGDLDAEPAALLQVIPVVAKPGSGRDVLLSAVAAPAALAPQKAKEAPRVEEAVPGPKRGGTPAPVPVEPPAP
ncbi:MAG: hypothetical protein V1755_00030, partial [Chloroflexota bacterium]